MSRLLLMRHAKSDRTDAEAEAEDFDRPLSERGREGAVRTGRHMTALGLAPQRILCSTARRARETLALMLPFFPSDCEIRMTRDLYLAGEDETIDEIRGHGGSAATLLVIGHEPGLTHTARALIGAGHPSLIEDLEAKFPTAGLAVIDFPAIRWVDVELKAGKLVAFLRPRTIELVKEIAADEDGDED